MPLLVAANITLDYLCEDICDHNDAHSRDSCYRIDDDTSGVYVESLAICDSCHGGDNGSTVLLQGLSEATDLELIGDPSVVRLLFSILSQCPMVYLPSS
jgi:hypothetical protein